MVLPINIIAALVTVLSRGITRQLGLPPPAVVENGSPNIYQVFGSIAIVITGIYYLLRCISNPQTARKSIRNHGMSSDQSLEEGSLAESRTVIDPHISLCIPKELPLRINSQESEISFPKRHPPRHETEEAKPSTSGISNLKRPYILEENYPLPKLRNVDDHFQHEHLHHDHLHHDIHLKKTDRSPNPELVHPEMATLKINDEPNEPTAEPSSECYLEEGGDSPSESRTVMDPHISACIPKELPLRINSQESEISFPKRHPPRHETEETKPSTSGISNLKRPYILEENYPPPKLRNVDDRFQHEHSHHDHLHHDNHLNTDRSPNPELVHPEMATLKINDEPTAEPSSEYYLEEGGDSPQNTPESRKESPENHRINHNIDLTTELVGDNTSQLEGEHMIRTTRSGKVYYGSKQREKRGYKRNK